MKLDTKFNIDNWVLKDEPERENKIDDAINHLRWNKRIALIFDFGDKREHYIYHTRVYPDSVFPNLSGEEGEEGFISEYFGEEKYFKYTIFKTANEAVIETILRAKEELGINFIGFKIIK